MSRSAAKKNPKPWRKTDTDLLILKEGEITTITKQKQIYRLRVVQWGRFQAVVEKRLYRFDKEMMDYIPGRSMGLNLEDMQVIYENKDKINEIMEKTKSLIDEETVYRSKLIAERKKMQEEAEANLN